MINNRIRTELESNRCNLFKGKLTEFEIEIILTGARYSLEIMLVTKVQTAIESLIAHTFVSCIHQSVCKYFWNMQTPTGVPITHLHMCPGGLQKYLCVDM